MRPSLAHLLPLAFTLGLLVSAAVRAGVEVEARLEPDPVSIEQAARLIVEVQADGAQPRHLEPHFELDNLQVIGAPQRSQTFRFMAGRSYHELRLVYFLRPLSAGPASVRAIRVEVDRDVYELPPQEIEVVADPPPDGRIGQSPRPQRRRWPDPWSPAPLPRQQIRPAEPKVFIRASVSPQRPWPGQQVLYRLTLYTQADVVSISAREIPPFRGFWAEILEREQREPELVTVEGETYGQAVILERVLVPRRSGSLRIEPATLDLVLRLVERRGLGRTLTRPEQIQRTSNAVTVDVRELPSAPAGFAGAVGDLTLEAELSPEAVSLGESATLTVTYRGSAHLPSLPPPRLPEIAGLEIFPPEESSDAQIVGDRLQRTRSWAYTLAPKSPGRFELGPFQAPVYDVRTGEFLTAASEPQTLTVRADPGLGSQIAGDPGVLHPIRSAAVPRESSRLLSRRALPWLLLPLGLVLALRWSRGPRRRPPISPENADARQRLEHQIAELAAPGATTDRVSAGETEIAWRDFLAERWGVSPALPAKRWAENLEERRDLIPEGRRLDARTLEALDEVAREIHYLRHAPQLSNTRSVRRELARRSRHLLRRLS